MDFGNEQGRRSRKESRLVPAWTLFMAGLCGVLAGALLVCFVLAGQGCLPGPGEEQQIPGKNGPADLSPDKEDPTVDVVSRVMPAVLAVNCYVSGQHYDQTKFVLSGSGSGAVISDDGYIVTNQHVIDGATKVMVVTPDSRSFEAKIIGEDQLTDLALLKIEQANISHIPLGNSDAVRVGETVLAAGNPLGFLKHTVTRGIVSALEREVRVAYSQYAYTYIQTDAVINPGNSGGPLVNLNGEVIGINSAKISGAEGIGLAIPANTVKRVVDDLRKDGRVRRPQLGIWVENLSDSSENPALQGVNIKEVIAGSPAAAGGLKAGDVITAVGQKEIRYIAQLFDALLNYYPGDRVELTIKRNGKSRTVAVVPGEAEPEE